MGGFGGSVLLIAVGAILKWAVADNVSGIDLSTVGVILMVLGVVGFIATAFVYGQRRRTEVVTTDREVVDHHHV